MPIEWTVIVSTLAIDAAFIKAGFLAIFKMMGYAWIFDGGGDKVRRQLEGFFANRGTKRHAAGFFTEFRKSNWVVMNNAMDQTKDTLEDGTVLFHYAEGGSRDGLLFATSCLFRVNGFMTAVTLPSYNRDGHYFVAFEYYQSFLKDHGTPHNIHVGRFNGERLEVSEQPIRMHVAEKYPPDPSVAKQISPAR